MHQPEFRNYKLDAKDKRNTITHIYKDGSGIIWFGTVASGLGKFDADRGTFHFYSNDPNDSTTISDNHVYFIQPEGNDILWIGTWGGGLNKFDKKQRAGLDPNTDTGKIVNWILENPDVNKSIIQKRAKEEIANGTLKMSPTSMYKIIDKAIVIAEKILNQNK